MGDVRWNRYGTAAHVPEAKVWLEIQANLGLAANTIDAYRRALDDYLRFCAVHDIDVLAATREYVARYVHDLASRPNARRRRDGGEDGCGLANATIQQRLTAIRLFYDFLTEEGRRATNPVGRGRYTPGTAFGGQRDRGLLPRYRKLPWIPSEEQWRAVLAAAKPEPLRNRVMLAMAYDAGLRRQEVCTLASGDVDPSARLLHIRAEATKGRRDRVVPYSVPTGTLFAAYLRERAALSRARGPLFLSASCRNRGRPISVWTWTDVVEAIARRAGVPAFTTHTLRHLCLTDLARAGWDLHEIARFAGHRNPETTLQYLRLSGQDLAAKVARGMAGIHAWRVAMTAEALG